MNNISIVTAFFDIGRGEWTPDKGLPHYLHRTNDIYLERFARLAQLENDITVFTSEDLVPRVTEICKDRLDRTTIIKFDPVQYFSRMRNSIIEVQRSESFKQRLNPSQYKNPEYWNPDYVLVTNLKAYFTNMACVLGKTKNDMVAWIDFGYCRNDSNITQSKTWNYNFDPTKIHLFNYKDYDGKPIDQVVLDNDVYILGAKVVAHKKMWQVMEDLMFASHDKLFRDGLVDDDQGLWLMSCLKQPESFELHRIPDHQYGHDPFVLFNQFNSTP